MNAIFIFGITILLMGGTDSLIEDAKTDKNIQQRILLRKLQIAQPEQEVKPSTWNEILADVLVNKIRIFSFKNQDKEDVIKEGSDSKDRAVLAKFFSSIFVVYKKIIYDAFVSPPSNNDILSVTPLNPESVRTVEPEDIVTPTKAYVKGPKSEVEFVEPKYHGKITQDDVTSTVAPDINLHPSKRETGNAQTNEVEFAENELEIETQPNVNDGKEGTTDCAKGQVKSENGDCVQSRLILAIPHQCPIGYRRDFLGNCRMILYF